MLGINHDARARNPAGHGSRPSSIQRFNIGAPLNDNHKAPIIFGVRTQ